MVRRWEGWVSFERMVQTWCYYVLVLSYFDSTKGAHLTITLQIAIISCLNSMHGFDRHHLCFDFQPPRQPIQPGSFGPLTRIKTNPNTMNPMLTPPVGIQPPCRYRFRHVSIVLRIETWTKAESLPCLQRSSARAPRYWTQWGPANLRNTPWHLPWYQ